MKFGPTEETSTEAARSSTGDTADTAAIAERPERRIAVLAEILGYLGGALALAAVFALLVQYWPRLGSYERIGVATIAGLAALIGGFLLERASGAAAERLSRFLLFAGVAGLAAGVGIATWEFTGALNATKHGEWAWFAGFAAAAFIGCAVWWRRRTVMQHLAFGLGVGIGSVLVLPLIPIDGPEWGAGLTLIVVALVWGALGLAGKLAPEKAAEVLASSGIIGGCVLMAIQDGGNGDPAMWALWVGLAATAALVIFGVVAHRGIELGFGAAGVLTFSNSLVQFLFPNSIAGPLVMMAGGLVFVGGAIFIVMRRSAAEKTARLAAQREAAPGAVADTPPAAQASSTAPDTALAPPTGPPPQPATAVAAPEPDTGGPSPIPLPAELLGYGGGAFAIGAAIALLGQFWEQLGLPGRLGVTLAGTALGLIGGFVIGRQGSPGAKRLEQFMLSVGIVASGVTGGIIAYQIAAARLGTYSYEFGNPAEPWAGLGGVASALVVGAIVWRLRPGFMTHLALGVAAYATIEMVPGVFDMNANIPWWLFGASTLAVSIVWTIGTFTGFFKPPGVAWGLASFGAIIGVANIMSGPDGPLHWAYVLGIALSILMVAGSVRLKQLILLIAGAIGMVWFSSDFVRVLFGERIAGPVLLLVIGVLFVAMAVLVAFLAPRLRRTPPPGTTAAAPPALP
ncbi:MAG: hypothetical protein HGB10_02595 [Coriobacteriia bacterium]|nr:hypothetical protein [Coriobacteriia bacterium]